LKLGKKTWIGLGLAVVVGVLAAGAYAYDEERKDRIAEGVTIGGIDVGGLDADAATAKVRRGLLDPLRHSLTVRFGGRSWELPGSSLKLHADVAGAVSEALEVSREGGLPGRLLRYASGGEVEESIEPGVEYSQSAINRFVRRVAVALGREPVDAGVEASGDSLRVTAGQNGRKLRDHLLTEQLGEAVLDGTAPRTLSARVHATRPELTRGEVAAEYPSYLTLDRSSFELRLWKHLKLAKTYTVAVGMEGLETPEGLYEIQAKEEEPVWHVPESAWAGDLAGRTIPPGPSNPIKARWMGIFEGAGIHGTEELESLGSAASHGCVRMAIPDVIELYSQVEVGTPIYIG
jgi:hypothetical protein